MSEHSPSRTSESRKRARSPDGGADSERKRSRPESERVTQSDKEVDSHRRHEDRGRESSSRATRHDDRERDRDRYQERDEDRDRERERLKEKERDRDRIREREKDRDRDREREKDRERNKQRDVDGTRDKSREKDRDVERDKDRDRHRDIDRDRSDRDQEFSSRRASAPLSAQASDSSKDGSMRELNIDEMNVLRAQLGLKPLRPEEPAKKKAEPSKSKLSVEEKRLERDKKSLAELEEKEQNTQDLKDKIQLLKEKRILKEKVKKARTLGDSEDESDEMDAAAWSAKQRQIAEEKRRAEERARQLAMEESSDSSADEWEPAVVREQRERKRLAAKGSNSLSDVTAGVVVKHKLEDLKEVDGEILTLKDRDIVSGIGDLMELDEGEDELQSASLVEKETRKKAAELKAGKGRYNPYADEEDPNDVLQKYDDEKEIQGITIDSTGNLKLDETDPDNAAEMRRQIVELALVSGATKPELAADFYTQDELSSFKKKKKPSKKSMRKKLDETLLAIEEDQVEHLGSKAEREMRQKAASISDVIDALQKRDNYQLAIRKATADTLVLPDEEEEQEVLASLNVVRNVAHSISRPDEFVAASVSISLKEETESHGPSTGLVLDSFTDFMPSVAADEDELLSLSDKLRLRKKEQQVKAKARAEERISATTASEKRHLWRESNEGTTADLMEIDEVSNLAITSDDSSKPPVGVGATLAYLRTAGITDAKKASLDVIVGRKSDFVILPEELEDESGVKIEYFDLVIFQHLMSSMFDKQGNLLSVKERFRRQSYVFHGKKSGKKKMEKMLKWQNEQVERKKKVIDDSGQFATMNVLSKSQKTNNLPYAVVPSSTQKMVEDYRQGLAPSSLSKK